MLSINFSHVIFAERTALLTILLLGVISNAVAQLQWTNIVYLNAVDNYLDKPGNLRTEWNAGAISVQNFYADGWVDFKFPVYKYAMMGLATYNVSVNPSTINHAIFAHINGYVYIYENGNRLPDVGKYSPIHIQYTPTDVFRVERKNGVVYYKKNGATFYTSVKPSGGPVHVDCSFYQAYSKIVVTDYMFGLVWTGSQSEDWNNPANWNLNRVPTAADQVIVNSCSTCPKLNNAVTIGALQLNSGSTIALDNYTLTTGVAVTMNEAVVKSISGKIVSSDFVEMKNSVFTGPITLEKTGGTENMCHGGNTFSSELKIVNTGGSSWQLATQSNNVISK